MNQIHGAHELVQLLQLTEGQLSHFTDGDLDTGKGTDMPSPRCVCVSTALGFHSRDLGSAETLKWKHQEARPSLWNKSVRSHR
jgi:hypothetical protein